MWHYVEGIRNWDPIWPHARHPHPARALVAVARRARRAGCPVPLFPGFDTLGTLAHIMQTRPRPHLVRAHPEDHREGVRALGLRAEPRHHRAASIKQVLRARVGSGAPGAGRGVQAARRGLRRRARPGRARARHERADRRAAARRRRARGARSSPATARSPTPTPRTCRSPPSTARARYLADRITRVAAPHRLLDPEAGPLIAVKLHILTRKTLGGLQTDLAGARAAAPTASRCRGLYAAARSPASAAAAMHGYRALEGTFLGGCLFSGRTAGRAAAAALA